ncbi:MAG: helix-turn-helix domain-containing protein [Bacteroidaceae bacterium]|nr:helix-turn-helix domain-containing protein [Bacteroidaceae bacterium]
MKFYTENEALDKVIGVKGTLERQEYDAQTKEFLIGEAIRQARQSRELTQEQLGKLVGVKKSQISKIENGCNVTFSTAAKLFNAMNIKAMLDLGSMGKVALF